MLRKPMRRHFIVGSILYATVYSSGVFGHEGMATAASANAHHAMHRAVEGMHKDMMGKESKGDVD